MNLTRFLYFVLILFLSGCELFGNKEKPIGIGQVRLESNTLYAVQGTSIPINLKVSVLDESFMIMNNPEFIIYVNGEPSNFKNSFPSSESGIFHLVVEAGEVLSDTLTLEIRPSLSFENVAYNIIFHIVHDGEEQGEGYNIGKDRIDKQMQLLESVFTPQNAKLTHNMVSPNLSFKYATVDPEGNLLEEPGINRIQRPSQDHSILFEEWMWDHYWDPDYYINVWIGDTKNGYSWGIYPNLECGYELEGLYCTPDTDPFDLQGIALELSNLHLGNWVFPHEMGHYFGLFHVFNDVNCNSDPDYSPDTYTYNRRDYEQGTTNSDRVSCSGRTYTSYNIMDYWNQPSGTGRALTFDQRTRIRFVVDHGKFRSTKNPETGNPRDMSEFKPDL